MEWSGVSVSEDLEGPRGEKSALTKLKIVSKGKFFHNVDTEFKRDMQMQIR